MQTKELIVAKQFTSLNHAKAYKRSVEHFKFKGFEVILEACKDLFKEQGFIVKVYSK